MPSVHLLVKGKVQGIFFRATARELAETLDLRGWVKNTPEGEVEMMVTGSEKALQQFIEWAKTGPARAIVTSVNITSISERPFDDFRVIKG